MIAFFFGLPARAQVDMAAVLARRGAVLRVPTAPGDGMGDVQNALTLATALKLRWPSSDFPVIVDPKILRAARRILGSEGLPLEDERSDVGRARVANHAAQIVFLPAGASSDSFSPGTSRFNLYLEEPGAPASDMSYVKNLPRGQVTRDKDGRVHLRLNPGFGRANCGMCPPHLSPESERLTRLELIELFADIGFPLTPRDARADWGFAYAHSHSGAQLEIYLLTLLRVMLRNSRHKSMVVFDLTNAPLSDEILRYEWPRLARWFGAHVEINILEFGGGPRRPRGLGRELTIVKVGAVPHAFFLRLMREADLPVAVTGTQSLNEAIFLDKPFIHEFLPWKLDLNLGMADVAIENFKTSERRFLVDLLTGEGDQMFSRDDVELSRAQLAHSSVIRSKIQNSRASVAAFELLQSPRRQALARRLISHLRSQYNLVDHIEKCARTLTQTPD